VCTGVLDGSGQVTPIDVAADSFSASGLITILDPVPLNETYEYYVTGIKDNVEGPRSAPFDVSTHVLRSGPKVNGFHHGSFVTLWWSSMDAPPGWQLLRYKVLVRRMVEANWSVAAQVQATGSSYAIYNHDGQSAQSGEPLVYSLRPVAAAPDGSVRELTMSDTLIVRPLRPSAPQGLSAVAAAGAIQISWEAPSYRGGQVAGYRLYRGATGDDSFVDISPASGLGPDVLEYEDLSVNDGQSYFYLVRAVNPVARYDVAKVPFDVAEVWDPLWESHSAFNQPPLKVGDASVVIGKYQYYFHPAERTIQLDVLPEWQTEYRFNDQSVDWSFLIGFESEDLTLESIATVGEVGEGLVEVDGGQSEGNALIDMLKGAGSSVLSPLLRKAIIARSCKLQLRYFRPFTPGVLMSDVRRRDARDPYGPSVHDETLTRSSVDGGHQLLPAALSCKPCGVTRLEVKSIEIDLKSTAFGTTLRGAISIALALGIYSILIYLAGLLSLAVNPVVAAAVSIALGVFLQSQLMRLVEGFVIREVRSRAQSDENRAMLDRSPLMWMAGEGLAETLARKVLLSPSLAEDGIEPNDVGRERFREQFWQMVVSERGACRVWVRKPSG